MLLSFQGIFENVLKSMVVLSACLKFYDFLFIIFVEFRRFKIRQVVFFGRFSELYISSY